MRAFLYTLGTLTNAKKLVDLSHTVVARNDHLQGTSGAGDLRFPEPRSLQKALCRRHVAFTSARSRWSRTPARISTVRFIALPTEKIFPNSRLSNSRILDGVVVHVAGKVAVDRDIFTSIDVRGKAVLVHTGWAQHWGTDQYFEGHTFLTEAAAEHLARSGRRAGRHRLLQHRRHRRRSPPCTHHAARREYSDRGTHVQPGALPETDFHFSAVPGESERYGNFSGARLRAVVKDEAGSNVAFAMSVTSFCARLQS